MFSKILIANRGEIACRIIKTAQAMNIATVAVYSEADRNALHVQMADESVFIGPSASSESYLVGDNIVQAALETGAEAIHPGYGFLSENADFCRLCAANNLIFIGPPVEAVEAMGSKSAAKTIMAEAGVPLVPGYHGADQSPDLIKQAANDMGYPVLLKAAAGGGGKGMRAVYAEDEFDQALEAAKREARNSFNDDIMLVEKYLLTPRHVEIQVFCDAHGNALHLFERDCSVQRRHQKVIEEAPAPGMSETLRQQMGEAAIKAALAINYQGAGTVEFLLDTQGQFYFMEMNARLQVEHPVTEMISGQDLVEWQLRVACGQPLPCSQNQLKINGHAFEARIYAEDPDCDFLPATGQLTVLQPPAENAYVRVDTGVIEGDEVSMYYDPMIAKLIVWDIDRDRALQRLIQALSEYRIAGLTNNIGFLYNLATTAAFKAGEVNTGFIAQHEQEIFRQRSLDIAYAIPIAAEAMASLREQQALDSANHSSEPNSPWHLKNSWGLPNVQLQLQIQGQRAVFPLNRSRRSTSSTVVSTDLGFDLFTENGYFRCCEVKPNLGENVEDGMNSLKAPMNGTLVALTVEIGSPVLKGDTLLVMEAMKMEHAILAPADGQVLDFFFQPGELVDGGTELLAFEVNENELP
ncbi:MAG: acetyl/propionyl/methylcrotonyl-CoA carboxylase subunit alpha [Porticoccaceae bacterium]|nr:acetyl/propionyl/methylcrotonyl-CoA carboxylase subunit alpha [Porticoccaceae bacterium]MBT5578224.1 acetyl/propionyl/methylcrotonyl-CoA carboxylase subunit alpha [Porticoccaceae bacterium]